MYAQIKWRPVFWGLGLQFALGLMILRWKPGYSFFKFLGDQVEIFLGFADEGSIFVFGEHFGKTSTLAPEALVDFAKNPEPVRKFLTAALALTDRGLHYQFGRRKR